MNKPPIEGSYSTCCRKWTVEHVPYGTFPAYADGGPPTVAHTEWAVSYPRLSPWSSPEVIAADDVKVELSVHRVVRRGDGYDVVHHPISGTRYDTDDAARRAAYEAGVIAYMVHLKDEAKYGI